MEHDFRCPCRRTHGSDVRSFLILNQRNCACCGRARVACVDLDFRWPMQARARKWMAAPTCIDREFRSPRNRRRRNSRSFATISRDATDQAHRAVASRMEQVTSRPTSSQKTPWLASRANRRAVWYGGLSACGASENPGGSTWRRTLARFGHTARMEHEPVPEVLSRGLRPPHSRLRVPRHAEKPPASARTSTRRGSHFRRARAIGRSSLRKGPANSSARNA